jgi:hypothetical protein
MWQSDETTKEFVIHAYGNTELLERANIEEPLEENLGRGYCNLLSVA